MTIQILFAFSGLMLALLVGAKLWEEKRKKPVLVLSLISLGDERLRNISHRGAEHYSHWKGRAEFFLNKQLPLHTKNLINKTNTVVKDKVTEYVGDIRGSRFLKKSDGLSEFFQTLSDREDGRIDETLPDEDTPTS